MSSVFMSQVVRPMAEVAAAGHSVELMVSAPIGEFLRPGAAGRWRERRRTIREDYGLTVRNLPAPPARFADLWRETAMLRRHILRTMERSGAPIVHCRGPLATDLAIDALAGIDGCKLVFDCRGLASIELLEQNGHSSADTAPEELRRQYDKIDRAERRAARHADVVIAVSNAMKEVITERWDLDPAIVHVIPCGTDVEAGRAAFAKREQTRQRLGLADKWVVAYNGSLAAYQCIDATLAITKELIERRDNGHFLAITTSPERMREKISGADISVNRATVVSVPQKDVFELLACADLGLLIRKPNMTNRVASPVKFAEYVACGVPVVISEGVGDYSALVERASLGWVMREPGVLNEILGQLMALCDDRQTHDVIRILSTQQLGNEISEFYRSFGSKHVSDQQFAFAV